jgi:hypothetical protein
VAGIQMLNGWRRHEAMLVRAVQSGDLGGG